METLRLGPRARAARYGTRSPTEFAVCMRCEGALPSAAYRHASAITALSAADRCRDCTSNAPLSFAARTAAYSRT